MKHNNLILLCLMASLLFACSNSGKDLETVESIDLEKFTGTWYEIARLPNPFEKGLICVTASYSLKKDGKIRVVNKGYAASDPGEVKKIRGTAWIPDKKHPGRLKVSFFWPFSGDYWIMAMDEKYRYALVGDPSRKYLCVLSKKKVMDPEIRSALLEKAGNKGFDTSRVIKTMQDCHMQL